MSNAPSGLPSHLSENTFRRYEKLIGTALRNWPEATKFTPSGDVSLTTFTARLRDSITSYRRYRWITGEFTSAEFDAIDGAAVVVNDAEHGCCFFTKRRAAGRSPAGTTVPNDSVPAAKIVPTGILTELLSAEIEALCLLLSNKRITGPITIQGDIGDETVTYMQSNYDVGITFDPSTKTTIIL